MMHWIFSRVHLCGANPVGIVVRRVLSGLRGCGLGFGVWGLGFGAWGLGFGVWGVGCGVWGSGV